MKTVIIDFINDSVTENFCSGIQGEHNATQIVIIPPADMPLTLSYRLAFEPGGLSETLFLTDGKILFELPRSITQNDQVAMTLEGYEGEIRVYKSKLVYLLFDVSVDANGDLDFGGEFISAEIAENTKARHTHDNKEVLDGFSVTKEGQLLHNDKPIEGSSGTGHSHSNKTILDKLGADDRGNVTYNGKTIKGDKISIQSSDEGVWITVTEPSGATTTQLIKNGESGAELSVTQDETGTTIFIYHPDGMLESYFIPNSTTFVPSVSENGDLSWSNELGLDNPDTVNIKGAKGDKGENGAPGAHLVGNGERPAGTIIEVDPEGDDVGELLPSVTTDDNGKVARVVNGEWTVTAVQSDFDYKAQGLPVLELTGDTAGMSKDVAVTLDYIYGELSGTCTVKWQGSSSVAFPKKNYTVKFDNAFEAVEGWGEQKKYCMKANWIDASHARNLLGARLWGQMCAKRSNVNATLQSCPNWGAVDGFPIIIAINGEFHGLYTFNIPKDGWMANMGNGTREAILCADGENDATLFKAPITLEGDFDLEYATDEDNTAWIVESINRLVNACINSDGTDIDTTIAQYIDIDSAIDYLIHTVVTTGQDNMDRNYLLMTYDGVKWFFTGYDMDTTFGLYWGGKGFTTADDYPFISTFAQKHRLMELLVTYKANAIKERWRELRRKTLSEINISKEVLSFASGIPKSVKNAEANKWAAVPSSDANTVYQIVDNLRLRLPLLDSEVEALVQYNPVEAPVMAANYSWYNTDEAGAAMNTITSVAFVPEYTVTGNEDASWACDAGRTGKIRAYRNGTTISIAPTNGADHICLNTDSTNMFANDGTKVSFSSLTEVTGTDMWVTASAVDMSNAFIKCSNLTTAPNIPNGVSKLSYAFQSCAALSEVSGVVIPESVTTLVATFRLCYGMYGNIIINAENVTSYTNCFDNTGKDATGITITGDCPILAELAATNTLGKVVVG